MSSVVHFWSWDIVKSQLLVCSVYCHYNNCSAVVCFGQQAAFRKCLEQPHMQTLKGNPKLVWSQGENCSRWDLLGARNVLIRDRNDCWGCAGCRPFTVSWTRTRLGEWSHDLKSLWKCKISMMKCDKLKLRNGSGSKHWMEIFLEIYKLNSSNAWFLFLYTVYIIFVSAQTLYLKKNLLYVSSNPYNWWPPDPPACALLYLYSMTYVTFSFVIIILGSFVMVILIYFWLPASLEWIGDNLR